MAKRIPNIKIEGAHIFFRNFAGKGGPKNKEGDRNFNVEIDDPVYAARLAEDGWNVRIRPARHPDDPVRHSLHVAVSFREIPNVRRTKIIMLIGKKRQVLDENTIGALDYADILNVDLTIRPRFWDDNGVERIKAYLQEMWVTIEEDDFADKYADYGDEEA